MDSNATESWVYTLGETEFRRLENASLAAMDANFEEKNIPSEKTHSPPRIARCEAMSHSPPRQKSPRPGRKIRDNYAQRLPPATSVNKTWRK